MADRTSDAQDRYLESVFRSEPIADDGFSDRLTAKIRRRIWVDRLALPLATLVGAAFAVKPAAELVGAIVPLLRLTPLIERFPQEALSMPMGAGAYLALGASLLIAGVSLVKMLEE